MFHYLRGIALIATMIFCCGAACAANGYSANVIMVGCRAFVSDGQSQASLVDRGYCAGLVDGISYALGGVCTNPNVTIGQKVRVVVKYVDDRPARQDENFILLAFEALRAAWPCKN